MCRGVPKHYTRSDVNPKYFLVVLAGDEKAVGGKKVVKSTAKDHVFVYYAGHRVDFTTFFPPTAFSSPARIAKKFLGLTSELCNFWDPPYTSLPQKWNILPGWGLEG
nr:vacuolar-processing enzyme-like [Tanacetum cinerariifolium]